jgi:poly(3-hydroxybutyrate) depolymerase
LAAAIELGEEGLKLYRENIKYLAESAETTFPPQPEWATPNRILLDLETTLLRDFTPTDSHSTDVPVLVDAPYAGHNSTIADYAKGQSLVETLQTGGLAHVFVTDWKSATREMKDFDIDKYLADIDKAVGQLGDSVHLIGLCQGGWMSAMYAALFPGKVRSLVIAGGPIDTDAPRDRTSASGRRT